MSALPAALTSGLPSAASVDTTHCWQDSTNDVCNAVYSWTDQNGTAAEIADWVVAKPAAIVGLLFVGWLVRLLLHRVIDRVTKQAASGSVPGMLQHGKADRILGDTHAIAMQRREQRANSMGSLLKNISTIVLAVIVAFMVIAQLGYNIAPLIASAGIIGVALGFGAQSLVKDFLSGIFMILEDQYGVGDSVDLGEAIGTVEAVGLRVTRVRDVNGTVWYVRNGEILRVGNQSQNWAQTVLDIPVAYQEDLTHVRAVLQSVAHEMWDDEDHRGDIIEEPDVWGVERWDPDAVVVRVVLKTAPLRQWAVAREMRERIKDRFDEEGIVIPAAERVKWMRHAGGSDALLGESTPPTPPGGTPGTMGT
ncbi:MAG: mechanosensitive ion channel family protein [Nocardioidaceae bacterium]|nr:mechanosensitive ion channel family protein [Nocardioidaceae bacterium]